MPIFEFKCLKCGEVYNLFLQSSDNPKDFICPTCGASEKEKQMTAPGKIFIN